MGLISLGVSRDFFKKAKNDQFFQTCNEFLTQKRLDQPKKVGRHSSNPPFLVTHLLRLKLEDYVTENFLRSFCLVVGWPCFFKKVVFCLLKAPNYAKVDILVQVYLNNLVILFNPQFSPYSIAIWVNQCTFPSHNHLDMFQRLNTDDDSTYSSMAHTKEWNLGLLLLFSLMQLPIHFPFFFLLSRNLI